jgi:ABC-type sulfate transport system substrate-binding protein
VARNWNNAQSKFFDDGGVFDGIRVRLGTRSQSNP